MGLEYELKYAADEGIHRAIREAFSGDWTRIEMETTYYDTPEGALGKLRFTLRLRMENGVPVCTLKTPAGDAGRGEWEVVCGSIEAAIPQLCKLSGVTELEALTREGVMPLCGARFTRMALTVPIPGGEAELALDRGVLFGGGREEALCEVEAELKSGTVEAVEEFGADLARRFALKPEKASKFKRARALVQEDAYGTA